MAKLNTDNSTNAALMAMAAIELFEKLTHHPIPVDTKTTLLEVFLGIGLWFTGKPSSATNRILSHLGIGNGLDNSGGVGDRDVSDRATLRGNPVDTARGQSGDYGDRLNAETLERIADSGDYVDRGPTPDPAARAARYFQQRPAAPVVGSPEIEGAGISAVEFSARSMGGNGQTEGFARLEEQQW
jgi:hypothetical protein